MYYNSEKILYKQIGFFNTCPTVFLPLNTYLGFNGLNLNENSNNYYSHMPGQCQAFLASDETFIWFIEEHQINAASFPPLFENKKVYPAKVTGLSLPLFNLIAPFASIAITVRWREGLIRYGSALNTPVNVDYSTGNFRPGFGQVIPADLQRPMRKSTVQTNNIGLLLSPQPSNSSTGNQDLQQGGRLMSMAFYVDPKLAVKYDASTSKKKKKSLNSQDYEQIPTYPPYTPYVDNSGY